MAVQRDLENLSAAIKASSIVAGFDTYRFGYLGEVNSRHNTDYPLMLLLPPTSIFGDVYKADEQLTLVFHLYKPCEIKFNETTGKILLQNDTYELETTYDLLMSMFIDFMKNLLKDREHEWVLNGGWDVERVSQEFNDNLAGLIITIKLNKYTHCPIGLSDGGI
jgi:hypothetical protein